MQYAPTQTYPYPMRHSLIYPLVLPALAAVVLYSAHVQTGVTPPAVLAGAGFWPIYTSAVLMLVAILFGYVAVADLVWHTQQRLFEQTIPTAVAKRPLPLHLLPLAPRPYATVGELLAAWGHNPQQWGASPARLEALGAALAALPDVQESWVRQPVWRPFGQTQLLALWPWLLLGGLVGARLYHVLAPAPSHLLATADYVANPWLIAQVWNGGLGIIGALLGGGVALAVFGWWHGLPVRQWGDMLVVGVALGQAIGRWGHFFNQELYGLPSKLPWAVTIAPAHRWPGLEEIATYHPVFLYESLWCLGLFGWLWWGYQRGYGWAGQGVVRYVGGYALGRLLIEPLRLDVATAEWFGLSLPVASWVSLAGLATAVVLLWGIGIGDRDRG